MVCAAQIAEMESPKITMSVISRPQERYLGRERGMLEYSARNVYILVHPPPPLFPQESMHPQDIMQHTLHSQSICLHLLQKWSFRPWPCLSDVGLYLKVPPYPYISIREEEFGRDS